MSDSGSAWRPTVPGYAIVREIGRGGFAVVYEAIQTSIDRPVALKVINLGGINADTLRRFRAECRTVGRLSRHPHVIALYDAGETAEGAPYLAMEMCPEGSLGEQVTLNGPLDPAEVARVGIEVADALTAAHEAGIIHRDLKPDNLMLGYRGEVLLADFGIATLTDGTASASGSFVGTIVYSAPELLRGQRANAVSDVYSLGATLYALAAGRQAFTADSDDSPAAAIWRITNEPPPPLPENVPDRLAAVITRSMAKDPVDRPQSAAALAEALRAARLEPPPTETTPSPAPVPPKPSQSQDSQETIVTPAPPSVAQDQPQVAGAPRAWRVLLGVLALALVVGLAISIRTISNDDASDSSVDTSTQSSATPAPYTVTDTIALGNSPQGMTSLDSDIWVANSGDDTVSQFDPTTNTVTDTITVGDEPVDIVYRGSSGLWVANSGDDTVSRIDPTTNTVTDTITVGDEPQGITPSRSGGGLLPAIEEAASPTPIWVANSGDDTVSRIDPTTNTVTDTITVGDEPWGITFSDDAVWVTNRGDDTVSRIDPTTNTVTDTITVGNMPVSIISSESAIWVANNGSDSVSRIALTTNTVVDSLGVGRAPMGITFFDNAIWVANSGDDTVSRVGLAANAVSDTVTVGDEPWGITSVEDAVWVTNRGDDTLSRIDRES